MAWMSLLIAGLLEIAATTALKLSDGQKRTLPTVLFYLLIFGSFSMMSDAMTELPLGTVYAIWTGIGAAGTAIIGMVFFRESASLKRMALLTVAVLAIVGLRYIE